MPKNGATTTAGAFAVLGIKPTASHRDAKKAFMKLSRENHPDKGGNSEEMAEVCLHQFTHHWSETKLTHC